MYLIEGAGLGSPLYVVVAPLSGGPHRLVYGDGGANPALVVTLEPLDPSGGASTRGGSSTRGGATGRKFSGTSKRGNIEEALQGAIEAALGSAGHSDALVEWTLVSTTGRQGSITGLNELTLTIEATVK